MPSQGTSTFDLFALRFHCEAQAPVHFPPGETANLFRGQLGKILYRNNPAAYARFFAPIHESGPSGLNNPPRPFVLRVRHLDGATLQRFHIGLNVFESDTAAIVSAMETLARESLRSEIISIDGLELLQFPLQWGRSPTCPPKNVRVAFLTPTELKNQNTPEFGPLFSRIRDRIGTLRALYGPGPLDIDFKAMGERAAAIRMTRCELQHVDIARSTGQRHSLGGFIGIAEYEGDLAEFFPYLVIAQYTGIGRQTVWGKGEISVETF